MFAFRHEDLAAYVRYLDFDGQGPPRVYLHGLGYSGATFAHIATHERLRGNRALLVDFLGFGLSDRPDDFSYRIDDHAEVVIRLLDGIGVSECDLIGYSLGGAVAVLVAARRPDLTARLVVAEGNLDPGGAPMSREIAAQSEEEYVSDGFRQSLDRKRDEARSDPGSIFATTLGVQQIASPVALYRTARSLVELTRPTVREELLSLTLPRTFLVGARTLEAEAKPRSGEAGERLEGTGVRRIVVPDAGHALMFHNPGGFADAIADALSDV